ncbi:MAG: ribonuclease H-like YkuK family protein [bacterium]|nr:ribonuclease H-like YkuK family protein [bacterium]
MNMFSEGKFFNPTKGTLSMEQVFEEIRIYTEEKQEKEYEIIVGCDSSSSLEPTFPLVVVVLRHGEGGRFFILKVKYPEGRKFHGLHERILQEVLLSCEFASFLREHFGDKIQYIHADIGEHGPTRDMIREITGLIRGNGFEPVIKPDSFAASSVADRFS